MLQNNPEQLSTVIALPLVTILLFWTVAIFHKNRKRWGPYDIPVVCLVLLSILRNLTVLAYTLVTTFSRSVNVDFCSVVTWLFNSIHTFQASSLTTIAVIGLFSVKLHRKNQSLRSFLTATHVVYHLFCLTTLCACVGVAAILAQREDKTANVFGSSTHLNPCSFLPFELDVKFNVFIIVLHIFLATVSFFSFLAICMTYYKTKKHGFSYMKKSNSDLSEISNNYHGINTNVMQQENGRNYYDTYTIQRNENNNYYTKDTWIQHGNSGDIFSNISATVSSTNSRRPCILRNRQEEEYEEELRRTGLETIHPVLIVCYMFYHLPLIVFCIHPRLIHPWGVAGIALWLGLIQDLLIPIGLGIVDSRFCKWVSNVYRCSGSADDEKLPQVGLDGKFRPFGLSSPPQTLEISQHDRNRSLQAIEHRFPITNGSLYTSIDGRLPVIHNYRRNKDIRTVSGAKPQQNEIQSSNVALHSSHVNRQESTKKDRYQGCRNCEMNMCPSNSDLHHLTPQYINKQLAFLQDKFQEIDNPRNFMPKRISQSQESLTHLYDNSKHQGLFHNRSEMNIHHNFNLNSNLNNQMVKNSRNLLRIHKMRLSRSDDSLSDLRHQELQRNNQQPSRTPPKRPSRLQSSRYSSSSEEECYDVTDKRFDSLSSNNSITTEANGDFEFFNNNSQMPLISRVKNLEVFSGKPEECDRTSYQSRELHNFYKQPENRTTIRRSNSKRSLESFQLFVEENNNKITVRRSNSCNTTTRDRKRGHVSPDENSAIQKMKSAEMLPVTHNHVSTVYIEDVRNNNKFVHSTPDMKKVFISEYI